MALERILGVSQAKSQRNNMGYKFQYNFLHREKVNYARRLHIPMVTQKYNPRESMKGKHAMWTM
jgi:hypothetical protein